MVQVLIKTAAGDAFVPKLINVSVGEEVEWQNRTPVAHTVTWDDGFPASGAIPAKGTYKRTFTAAGTFTYHCDKHPYMTGTVVVS